MIQVYEAAFSTVNIVPSFLLLLCLLYWLIVILGMIDMNVLDFDVETPEADVDGEISIAWMNNVLSFFNIGKVPFMVFLTFFSLSLWVVSIMLNYYVNYTNAVWFSVLLLIPNFLGSLFVAKFTTYPFVKMFAKLENDADNIKNAIGKECIITLPTGPEKIGQAEINKEGTVLKINVISEEMTLQKGEKALVIDFRKEKNLYLVEAY